MGTYLTRGKTFASGDTVTHADLNNLVDDAEIQAGGVKAANLSADQTNGVILGQATKATAAATDKVLIQETAGALKQVTLTGIGALPAPWSASLDGNDCVVANGGSGNLIFNSVIGRGASSAATNWHVDNSGMFLSDPLFLKTGAGVSGGEIHATALGELLVARIGGDLDNVLLKVAGNVQLYPMQADKESQISLSGRGASWATAGDAHDHSWSITAAKTGELKLFKFGGAVGDNARVAMFVDDSVDVADENGAVGIRLHPQGHAYLKPQTMAELNALSGLTQGMIAYCTNGDAGSQCLAAYDGASWKRIVMGATLSAS